MQTVQIKVVRESSHVSKEKKADAPLISFDDEKAEEGAMGEGDDEGEVVIVEVPRLSFDSDKDQAWRHTSYHFLSSLPLPSRHACA